MRRGSLMSIFRNDRATAKRLVPSKIQDDIANLAAYVTFAGPEPERDELLFASLRSVARWLVEIGKLTGHETGKS
jgi:hypothetical protein